MGSGERGPLPLFLFPCSFCYAARCLSASLVYLRRCARICLLVLLVVVLLLVLVTLLHDHARCLCSRGDRGVEHVARGFPGPKQSRYVTCRCKVCCGEP